MEIKENTAGTEREFKGMAIHEVYRQILGLPSQQELPSISELLEGFLLPNAFLGDLIPSIDATKKDGRERCQLIRWRTSGVKMGQISVGIKKDEVNIPFAEFLKDELHGLIRPHAGFIVDYHTHYSEF